MARTVLIAVLFILGCNQAMAAPQVLIVHSYHQGNEWVGSVTRGMEMFLQEALPEAELFTEHMDSKRHPPDVIFPLFKQYLAAKYSTRRFDVILCSDDNALDFFLAWRDELFPGVPVVFCGINNLQNDRLVGRSSFTGVAEKADLQGTLNLALQLHPKTRQIAVISDITPSGRANLQRLREIEPAYAGRLEFLELAELAAPQLKEILRSLPSNSMVILLDYFRDPLGGYFTVEESNKLICQASRCPVYSLWDFRVKAGVVGGRVTSGQQQGAAAAHIALRILRGESPANIPIVLQSPNEYLFDYPALMRFHIPLNALPQGSRILHRPPFFFHLSRGQLLTVLFIISIGALVLLTNIVLRLRAERTLKNRQARLKAIHENVAAGIALADTRGRYLEVNDKWAEMFGCSTGAFIGKSFLDVTFTEDREENCQEIQDLLAGRTDHYRLQKRFTREDGTVFWVDNSVTRIINQKGQVEALIGIIIDISEHKQAEEQLQAANLELDAFVRTASHDLRSPLTGIIGFAEFLGKEYRHQLDDQGVALLHHIEQSGHKMRQLLEDLLSFAWVGYVETPQQPVDADLVALEVILIYTQKANGVIIDKSPLPAVHIPRSFLFQLFDNLIGNAVRYAGSAAGPIEVGGALQRDRIRFFVRDHGPGVAPEEREQIFAPFYRGAEGQKISGTGIGLATVRKIARIYGGRAWQEETPGGGCTFWVEMQNLHPERHAAVSPPAALYL